MARPIEKALAQALRDTQFSFIENGEREINEVYVAVQREYGELCDDNYLCAENCKKGSNQPEWNHMVRTVMGFLRKKGVRVRRSDRRRFWIFF